LKNSYPILSYFERSLSNGLVVCLGGAPDSVRQQARCCRAVFNLELELSMHFILNQNGELVITDEGEEVCELDETVE
jgi:hypothetical protein